MLRSYIDILVTVALVIVVVVAVVVVIVVVFLVSLLMERNEENVEDNVSVISQRWLAVVCSFDSLSLPLCFSLYSLTMCNMQSVVPRVPSRRVYND